MNDMTMCKLAIVFLFLFLPCLLPAQSQPTGDTLFLREVEIRAKGITHYPAVFLLTPGDALEPQRDLGDLLRHVPNVAGIRKGGIGIDPVVRGLQNDQVSVVLNHGVRIEGGCPNRMDPVASRVENSQIESVAVIRGPYVLKYGPVLGAVVDISVRMPEPRPRPGISVKSLYGFETNWNGQREYLSLTGGNRRIFFRAGGGFNGYGSYRAGDGRVIGSSFRKIYGDAGLGWTIGDHHTFRAGTFFNQGEDALFPALPMDEKVDRTHLAMLQYQANNPGKNLERIDADAYGSRVHHVMDNLLKPTAATMQAVTTVDACTAGVKAAASFSTGRGRMTAGMDIGYVQKDGEKIMTMRMIMSGDTFVSVKHTRVWTDARILNSGCYGEYSQDLNGWNLTAALRADLNRATSGDTFRLIAGEKEYVGDQRSHYLTVSFSFGVRKELLRGLTLRAALAKGTRCPSLLERYIRLMPVRFDSYDYLGNPRLRPEHNYQADAGLEVSRTSVGTLSAGVFFSAIQGYIHGVVVPPSVIKPSTQGAPGVKQFTNAGVALLRGFELSYRSPSSEKWDVQISAAATWGSLPEATRYLLTNGQVTGEEIVKNDPLPEIPPLEGTIRAGYRFLHGCLLPAVTLRLVAAQTRVSQAYREPSTPGFATVGAAITYMPCRFAILSVAVTNLFDSPYYEHLNRRIVGSVEKLYEPGRAFQFTVTLKYD